MDTLINERLLSKDFYLEHLSLFLKNSFGMIDREETYRAILNNVNDISIDFFSRLDIYNLMFQDDYFERNKPDGMSADEYKESYSDDVLDVIAGIFGIKREFNIQYYGANINGHYGSDPNQLYKETITLNNRELLIYIQVIITRLNYQGTAGEIKNLYYGSNTEVQKLKIYYTWSDQNPLNCNVYFCNSEEVEDGGNYNSNLVKLFLSDNLLIESLGVEYKKNIGLHAFQVRFDVDTPDIANHKYIFDPDFTQALEPDFTYGVFSS